MASAIQLPATPRITFFGLPVFGKDSIVKEAAGTLARLVSGAAVAVSLRCGYDVLKVHCCKVPKVHLLRIKSSLHHNLVNFKGIYF